jgi:protein-S-isoprenylcysteine O-methyltransferase Ste14
MSSSAAIGLIWLVFIIVWIVSAFTAKRTTARRSGVFWFARIIIIVIAIELLSSNRFGAISTWYMPLANTTADWIGVALVALGVALSVWARFYLGSNWGMPMSLKENPELVTSGPYSYIRNPIYTGVMLAMIGSGLGVGALWWIIFVVTGAYFIYASVEEEKIMLKEFPDTYPAYKARTKRLVPFIF